MAWAAISMEDVHNRNVDTSTYYILLNRCSLFTVMHISGITNLDDFRGLLSQHYRWGNNLFFW